MSEAPRLLHQADLAMQRSDFKNVVALCQEALKQEPNSSRAYTLLAHVQQLLGHYASAVKIYDRAIGLDDKNDEAYVEMSNCFAAQWMPGEAVQVAKLATEIAPEKWQTHSTLVKHMMRFNHAHMALDYLENMIDRVRGNAELSQSYCNALKANDDPRAWDEYQSMLARFPATPAGYRIMFETHLPRLLISVEEIETARERFLASLNKFIAEKPTINLSQIVAQPLFYLAFHPRDSKPYARRFSEMLRVAQPQLNFVAPHAKNKPRYDPAQPIRIGFCSRYMHDHSVGRCYRNAMLHLHRDPRFKVTLFTHDQTIDGVLEEAKAKDGLEIVVLPRNFEHARQIIAERRHDILIYPDVAMDIGFYFLSLCRLAPYQCALTGHPDTTGVSTMDYFISSRLYEPPHGQDNYTEQLLVTPRLDTLFARPAVPDSFLSREELGLPADKTLYVVPMAIQKMHPDFDGLLKRILDRDPKGLIVLFNDFDQKSASEMLQKRIRATIPEDRVLFLEWQTFDRLQSIMKAADAVLATIHFGAGTTGQYSITLGVPMVTLDGDYARSRILGGQYRLLEIEDAPIATNFDEYVEFAYRVAHDAAYKARLSAQLLERNGRLFLGEGNDYGDVMAQMMVDIMKQDVGKYRLAAQA